MSNKGLLDAVQGRNDIGRRVGVFTFPISNGPRVTSRCTGKLGLGEPGKHAASANLASRNNVGHGHNY